MFSSSEVADPINLMFEPVWESVRAAPLVTLDFGNGHTMRRTLQGNVATYICGPSGIVYDILPGIYTPAVYLRELEASKRMADSLNVWSFRASLRTYHAQQSIRLQSAIRAPRMQAVAPKMQVVAQTGGGFKGGFGGGQFKGGFGGGNGFGGGFQGIEGPTERVIMGLPVAPFTAPSEPLKDRPELAFDAEVNEHIRRRAIHQYLAQSRLVHPDEIKKWLFKEILRVNLDDPLLGLGDVLNANYPFADEDRALINR